MLAARQAGPMRKVWVVARAEHHCARWAQVLEDSPHRVGSDLADPVGVALAQQSRTCKGRGLGGMHEIEGKFVTRLKGGDPPPGLLQGALYLGSF